MHAWQELINNPDLNIDGDNLTTCSPRQRWAQAPYPFSRYRYSGFSKATLHALRYCAILHENKKSCNRANRAIVNVPSIPLLAYDKWKLGINIILSSVTNHPCPFFDVQYCLSSADWCTAGPLLTDVLYSTAGPLLTDVLLVLCWVMYCWSSFGRCTADPRLFDVPLGLCMQLTALRCQSATDWCNVLYLSLNDLAYLRNCQ